MDDKNSEVILKQVAEKAYSEIFPKLMESYLKRINIPCIVTSKGEEIAQKKFEQFDKKQVRRYIKDFLKTVEVVKTNKKMALEEKLRMLISPLKEIKKMLPRNEEEKEGRYHFVNEKAIDLKKEVNLKNLTQDPNKYFFINSTELNRLGFLRTDEANICLSEEYEFYLEFCRKVGPVSEIQFEKMIKKGKIEINYIEIKKYSKAGAILPGMNSVKSISQIWPIWLPILNMRMMKSKDFLTQILVCYTIKRALNGDERAVEKLCNCYENAAEGLAINFAVRNKLFDMKEEIISDTKMLLPLLIRGFRPEMILEELIGNFSSSFVLALPKWVKRFYLSYLTEHLPSKLAEIMAKSGLVKEAKKEGVLDNFIGGGNLQALSALGLELMVLLNPFRPIHEATRWKSKKFNSYSYTPSRRGPRSNLTLWLFGTSPFDPKATLYRLLRDKYRSEIERRKSTVNWEPEGKFKNDYEGRKNFRISRRAHVEREEDDWYRNPEAFWEDSDGEDNFSNRDEDIF